MTEGQVVQSANGTFKIHNAHFYNLKARSIVKFALNQSTSKLAVARNDFSIEIWDLKYAPYMEKQIPGIQSVSVEALGWVGNRLLSTGLCGDLTEWNLKNLAVERSLLLTGSSAWCLDVRRDETRVAIGTEEGYINIYDVENNELNFIRIFDKQEGRVICCKFDWYGNYLVTGSLNAIRVWNVDTGHAIHKLGTGRTERNKDTVIWCLSVLQDFTILSGDSRGRITVWDGKMGAQVDSFVALRADVLAIDVNEEEDTFCCVGVDPIIKVYKVMKIKRENVVMNRWIKFIQRSVHDLDVRAIAISGNVIYSGSNDGCIGVSTTSKIFNSKEKFYPYLEDPCTWMCKDKRLVLFKYFNQLEIWSLGVPSSDYQLQDDEADDNKKYLNMEKGHEKILELKSNKSEPIICGGLSPDGSWIVYCTNSSVRVFRLNKPTVGACTLRRIKIIPKMMVPSLKLLFSDDSKSLFLVNRERNVEVFMLNSETDEIDFDETIETSKHIKDTIQSLTVSKNGNYLVVSGSCCSIAVWQHHGKKRKEWKHYTNLPKYTVPPTAIAIHENLNRLVAAFPDLKIFEYDLDELRFTCSIKKPTVNLSTHKVIKNILLDPNNDEVVLLQHDNRLVVLRKSQDNDESKVAKIENEMCCFTYKIKKSLEFEHFIGIHRLSSDELVFVGANPETIVDDLPPAFRQKKFGQM